MSGEGGSGLHHGPFFACGTVTAALHKHTKCLRPLPLAGTPASTTPVTTMIALVTCRKLYLLPSRMADNPSCQITPDCDSSGSRAPEARRQGPPHQQMPGQWGVFSATSHARREEGRADTWQSDGKVRLRHIGDALKQAYKDEWHTRGVSHLLGDDARSGL